LANLARTTSQPASIIIIEHGDGTRPFSSDNEALRREVEGGLMREGNGKEEPDAARVIDHKSDRSRSGAATACSPVHRVLVVGRRPRQ